MYQFNNLRRPDHSKPMLDHPTGHLDAVFELNDLLLSIYIRCIENNLIDVTCKNKTNI